MKPEVELYELFKMSVRLSPSSGLIKCKARPTSKPTEDVQLLPLSPFSHFLVLSLSFQVCQKSGIWHRIKVSSCFWFYDNSDRPGIKTFLLAAEKKLKKMSDIWNSIWVHSDRIKNMLFKMVSSLLSCAEAPLGPSTRLSVHSHQPLSLGTLIVLWKVLRIISLRPRHVLN